MSTDIARERRGLGPWVTDLQARLRRKLNAGRKVTEAVNPESSKDIRYYTCLQTTVI